LVASGKGIRIEGSGNFSGGFNWVELRVRVGGSGGSGVRSMVQAENTPFLRRAAAVTAIIKRRQWPTHSRARVHVTDVLLLHRIIQFTE
jgi:hypothetical protein